MDVLPERVKKQSAHATNPPSWTSQTATGPFEQCKKKNRLFRLYIGDESHYPIKKKFGIISAKPFQAWLLLSQPQPPRWRIQWVGEGILNARVDAGVGELQIVRGPERGDLFKMGTVGWANPTKILSCKLKGNSENSKNHDVEGPFLAFFGVLVGEFLGPFTL